MTGEEVEQLYVSIVEDVKQHVTIPVAVKLAFFSSLPNIAARLDTAGADALVLFNRFYQPDLDIEASTWSPPGAEQIRRDAAAAALDRDPVRARQGLIGPTTGIHTGRCAQGGHGRRRRGQRLLGASPGRGGDLLRGITTWMEEHEYNSIE